ncbi:YopX family protein [Alishewanella sp. SMS9]|nr:YopX family protein [Alishewanella sp. SMS9]
MNRVIKFRQFAMGKMFYWGFGAVGDESHFSGPVSGSGVLPHKSPQMQFTGLHDVNGVEIYEDDILYCSLTDCNGVSNKYIGKVFYQEYEFCIELDDGHWPVASFFCADKFKVIGNIYQNPELLGGAK